MSFWWNEEFFDAVYCSIAQHDWFDHCFCRQHDGCLWQIRHNKLPNSLSIWCYSDSVSVSVFGTFYNWLHPGRQHNKQQFDGFCGIKRSKPISCQTFDKQMTITHLIQVHRPFGRAAGFGQFQEAIQLFFIQRNAVSWETPNIRPSPREETRSCAALINCSLTSSDFRNVLITPTNPQSLHLNLGFPTEFEPFLTTFIDWHFLHLKFSVIMIHLLSEYPISKEINQTKYDTTYINSQRYGWWCTEQ